MDRPVTKKISTHPNSNQKLISGLIVLNLHNHIDPHVLYLTSSCTMGVSNLPCKSCKKSIKKEIKHLQDLFGVRSHTFNTIDFTDIKGIKSHLHDFPSREGSQQISVSIIDSDDFFKKCEKDGLPEDVLYDLDYYPLVIS